MENKDVVLLMVDAIGGVVTPVQLQKSVFLVSTEGLDGIPASLYDFQPYHYGPFDRQVYTDADRLYQDALVLRTSSRDGAWTDTMIMRDGWESAQKLRKGLPPKTRERIDAIADLVRSKSFPELVKYVYEKFPKYRENSVFQT
jgi:CubicO group peptidase (beta-lactamase class C family)